MEILGKEKPKLVYLGASRILFPHPVKAVSEFVHDYGGVVIYDGSHVLGLIAGGKFQDPLREGADALIGSTHKTFPGPQGGVILTNNEDVNEKIESVLSRPYMLVDNPHVARIAALGITSEEMRKYGVEYANSIIKNSKELASNLEKLGIPVKGRTLGYTRSHQILLDVSIDGFDLKNKLEVFNIFIDAIGRIGTQEVTRRGMSVVDMKNVAELIYRGIKNVDVSTLKEDVASFAARFNRIKFSFDD